MQLELGKVCAVSVDHHWALEAQVRVQLRGRQPNHYPPSRSPREWIEQRFPWISRANGLTLAVKVVQQDALQQTYPSVEKQKFLAALRRAIADAELWQQLGLDVSTLDIGTVVPSTDEPSFTFDLRHSSSLQQDTAKRLHRLNVGDSAADLKPPDALDVFELEQIFMTLTFKLEGEEFDVSNDSSRQQQVAALRSDEEELPHMIYDQDDEDMLDAKGSAMLTIDELSPLLLDETLPVFTQHRPPAILPSTRMTTSAPARPHSITIPAAIDLLDAAFRSVICSKPSKLSLGIWLPKRITDLSLSTLAPTLFCPGYAKAVAERACFLPTITHALCHSILLRARSRTLRTKLERLRLNDEHECGATPSSLSEMVKARLWKTIQRGVYKEDAASRLRPLKAPTLDTDSTRRDDDDDNDDMLEPTYEELAIAPLRARTACHTRLGLPVPALVPQSPILLGRLGTYEDVLWDGGLLARPVSNDLLARMLQLPGTQQQIRLRNDDSASMLDDGAPDDDSMLDDRESLLFDEGDYNGIQSIMLYSDQGGHEPDMETESMMILDFDEVSQQGDHDDDSDTLLNPDHNQCVLPTQIQESLLHAQDKNILLPLEDDEDTNLLFSSQESSLTAMTIYSDHATELRGDYNTINTISHTAIDIPTTEQTDDDEDMMLSDTTYSGWRSENGTTKATNREDDDMLGVEVDDNDNEDVMLAF